MDSNVVAYTQNNYADAPYELLERFDDMCTRNGISYFAVGSTLIGALCYGDFIPKGDAASKVGDPSGNYAERPVLLGMTRPEFKKLRAVLASSRNGEGEGAANQGSGLDIAPMFDGEGLFSLAGRANGADTPAVPGKLSIAIYDIVTDDYDLTRYQLFRIKKLKSLAGKSAGRAKKALLRRAWAVAGAYRHDEPKQVANLLAGDDQMIEYSAVAHTRRVAFGRGSIMVPSDSSAWISSDETEEMRRVKAVQKDSLAIACEVDRICRANGIGYFICAGTLLGAMRHGGFIPWDDDMDIGMLREDFDRFVACATSQLDNRFFLQTRETDPAVPYLYAKVRMNGTEYVTSYTESRSMHKGISVDIFPFDYAPVEQPGFQEHLEEANRLIKAHKSRAARQVPDGMPRRRARNLAEVIGHAAMASRHRYYNALSTVKTYDAYVSHVSKYSRDESTHAVSYVTYFTSIPLDDLLPYAEVDFEGLKLLAPKNPDPLMRMQFGDYLQKPPPHLQHGHNVLRWKTSNGEASA